MAVSRILPDPEMIEQTNRSSFEEFDTNGHGKFSGITGTWAGSAVACGDTARESIFPCAEMIATVREPCGTVI
jgi:hypothetical protein